MNDPPRGAFASEDDGTAPEPFGVVELERGEYDTWRQGFDAEVGGREALKGRPAACVSAHVGEHGAERGVDRPAAGHALGQVRGGMEDCGGVAKGIAKRFPVEVFESGKEAVERARDGGRVAASGLARLGADGEGEEEGKPGERANDLRRAAEERSQHHKPISIPRSSASLTPRRARRIRAQRAPPAMASVPRINM